MELGMYVIMALEPISTAYFINSSYESVCLYVYLPIVSSFLLIHLIDGRFDESET
jgi:hypothetical protein